MIEKYVDQEELRRLFSSLLVVLGVLVIAGLFAIIVVPGLRNANKPRAAAAVIPTAGETGWLDPTEFPPQKGRAIPPVDPRVLMERSDELLARGKELYAVNCSSCHGRTGNGDGPAAATMNPPPRNFTIPDGWKVGHDMASIYRVLSEGVQGTSMRSFDYLRKADRMALLHYVQSLGSFVHAPGSPEAIEALSKELASPGERIPNRIPVSMAMTKLEEEFEIPPPIDIRPEDESDDSALLLRALSDRSRAALILKESESWRTSPQALAASILPNAPGNGFSIQTAVLTAEEWQALHGALIKRVGQK